MASFSLHDLEKIIDARIQASASGSYTKSLLDSGVERVCKKFGEEAVETVVAALRQDETAVVAESADVLYHLLVLLKSRGVALDAVLDELARRTAQSGHAEKASRAK